MILLPKTTSANSNYIRDVLSILTAVDGNCSVGLNPELNITQAHCSMVCVWLVRQKYGITQCP